MTSSTDNSLKTDPAALARLRELQQAIAPLVVLIEGVPAQLSTMTGQREKFTQELQALADSVNVLDESAVAGFATRRAQIELLGMKAKQLKDSMPSRNQSLHKLTLELNALIPRVVRPHLASLRDAAAEKLRSTFGNSPDLPHLVDDTPAVRSFTGFFHGHWAETDCDYNTAATRVIYGAPSFEDPVNCAARALKVIDPILAGEMPWKPEAN